MSNQENQFGSVNYWLQLNQFYSKTSSMILTLIDSDGKVMVKIAPALDPNGQGRPQAGVAAYDYNNAISFSLSISECQAIIFAHEKNLIQNEQVSFVHMNNGVANIGAVSYYQGYYSFNISSNGKSSKYPFQNFKLNKDSSTFIPYEFELFVNMLKSVINNIIDIKSKKYPVFVPRQRDGNQGGNYNNQNRQNNYQPKQNNYQQQAQPQKQYQQNNYQPQNSGLPQSNNGQSNAGFDMSDSF